jgi:hypothetical protein
MTSAEIKQTQPTDLSTNGWLKVVALQLSILIESLSAPDIPVAQSVQGERNIAKHNERYIEPIKRGPGRPRIS